MIQALTCPSCNQTSRLNQEVSSQAVLKCRHCGSQFVLGEMIDSDSSPWEVVDDPFAPSLMESRGSESASSLKGEMTAAGLLDESPKSPVQSYTTALSDTTSEIAFNTHVEDEHRSASLAEQFEEGFEDSYVDSASEFSDADNGLEIVNESELSESEFVNESNTEHLDTATLDANPLAPSGQVEVTASTATEQPVSREPVAPQPAKKKVDWSKFDNGGQDHSRAKKKARSPIWSMLSIASGGFAAVPIATLLIWHVLGKDPLEMGPSVARYVPWIVPTRFHPYQSSNEPPTRFARPENRSAPAAGTSGFRKFDDVMPKSQIAEDKSANDANASPAVSLDDDAKNVSPVPVATSSDLTLKTDTEPNDSITAESAPEDSQNVFSQIKLIEDGLEAWSKGKEQLETKKMVAQKLYGDLSALALIIHDVPSGNPVHRVIADKMKKSAREIAEQSDVQQVIQAGSRFWIAKNKQENNFGLALIGEVISADVASGEWVLKISPEISTTNSVQIVVPGMLSPSIEVGQKLLMLGAVKDSAEQSAEAEINSLSEAPKGIKFVADYIYVL